MCTAREPRQAGEDSPALRVLFRLLPEKDRLERGRTETGSETAVRSGFPAVKGAREHGSAGCSLACSLAQLRDGGDATTCTSRRHSADKPLVLSWNRESPLTTSATRDTYRRQPLRNATSAQEWSA
jgi:hypothetical protein